MYTELVANHVLIRALKGRKRKAVKQLMCSIWIEEHPLLFNVPT